MGASSRAGGASGNGQFRQSGHPPIHPCVVHWPLAIRLGIAPVVFASLWSFTVLAHYLAVGLWGVDEATDRLAGLPTSDWTPAMRKAGNTHRAIDVKAHRLGVRSLKWVWLTCLSLSVASLLGGAIAWMA